MSPAPRRAALEGVSVLLLARPGGPAPDPVLDALAQQRPRPDVVVAVGLSQQAQEAARAHPLFSGPPGACSLVILPAGSTGADAPGSAAAVSVRAGMGHLPQDPARWVWILHDDSGPRPGALAALLDVARRSARVRVVGPKLVRADDPRTLLGVGHRLTRGGRPVAEDGSGQLDQGQFDDRTDVVGLPLPGLLVRSDVLTEIGGVDPAFDEGTEGLDLCWRSHLRGHRVLVAPQAVVAQGSAGLGLTSPSRHRRRMRQVALARCSLWSTPWRVLRVCVGAVLATLLLLLLKRPRAALAELADLGSVLALGRSTAARWRFRGRRQVRDRDLRGLFEPARSDWRSAGEPLQDPAVVREPPATAARRGRSAVETGPGIEGSDENVQRGAGAGGWWSWWPVLAVLVCLAVTLARWRGLYAGLSPSGSGVRGGELEQVHTGAHDVWSAWLLPWSGAGLGTGAPGPPWLLPLAGASWVAEQLPGADGGGAVSSAGVATAWLLFLAPPAAALTAYSAARVASPHRGLRAVVALCWATLAPLWVSVDQGRVGPVVVHVLAPVLVAGVVRSLDRSGSAGRSTAAVLGAGLAGAAALWFVPGVLVWLVLAAVLILLGAAGWGRWRAVLILAVPVALWGPWARRLAEHPLLLAGGAGATGSGEVPPVWQTLLLHPGGPLPPVLWWTAPLWVLALLSSVAPGRHGSRATAALACALCGLGVALAAPRVQWGTVAGGYPDAGSVVTSWPGTYLSLTGAGLLLAAASGAGSLTRRAAPPGGRAAAAPVVLAGAAVMVLVAVAATLGTLGWRALGTPDPTLAVSRPTTPAVVAEQIRGPAAPRWLALTPMGAGEGFAVRYTLTGAEPDPWVRDRVREIVEAPDTLAVTDETVRRLVDGDLPGLGTSEGGIPPALADLAIGYVTADAPADHPLVARIDEVPGLTRITTPTGAQALWRVLAEAEGSAQVGPTGTGPGRVRIQPPTGRQIVVPSGAHGAAPEWSIQLPAGSGADTAATLLVSEPEQWSHRARVRADGATLPPHGGLPVRYDVPAQTRTVSVTLPVEHRPWWVGTGALALLLAFLALPLGSHSGRSP
ncbi:MAG: glycosyltransferase [Ornithinimicrobium sp.]|uniref:glycosyltransferase n=1 Tax=Ornithinimicrobium sp. TaxID=1977084 RepID=UPI003D9BB183